MVCVVGGVVCVVWGVWCVFVIPVSVLCGLFVGLVVVVVVVHHGAVSALAGPAASKPHLDGVLIIGNSMQCLLGCRPQDPFHIMLALY